MRLATLLGPDLKIALETDPESIGDALEEFHPEDVAEIVEDLALSDAVAIFGILSADFGAQVLERIHADARGEILEQLSLNQAADLLGELAPDDRVDVVQELQDDDEQLAASIVAHLEEQDPEAAEELRELSVYAEDVAGGLMTPSFAAMPPDMKVWQAIEEVRRVSMKEELETIYYVYVVYGAKLVGVVSLRELILSDPSQTLADIMMENVVSVLVTDDQEVVAQTIARYDFSACPVVDEHGNMLGVVTVDDVVDVVIEEATEDAHKMGAMSPMEDGYFETSRFSLFHSRITWLSLLFVGGFLTASVMERFSSELEAAISLTIFIPLIISSGGNSGSQSATLIIRAMAIGDVEPADWWKILGRETLVGIALGVVLGMLGFARAFFAAGPAEPAWVLGLAIATSTVGVVLVGSLVGSLLPLAIQRVGLDPAVSSTPMVASLVDVVGLMLYLTLANAILHMV